MKFLVAFLIFFGSHAQTIFIPMDNDQRNHLKAYGLAYWVLSKDQEVRWLINYKGGGFLIDQKQIFENECILRGISYVIISPSEEASLITLLKSENLNTDVIPLNKAAKVAVYSPKKISSASFEDTDAVINVLKYAEIPFELVYDEEVIEKNLLKFDWLHLHHEDFTGQFGKNLHRISYEDKKAQEQLAQKFGYLKVSQLKLAVAKEIKAFCAGGGYLFAMCSGTESIDVALAAEGLDIVGAQYDGDGLDRNIDSRLNYNNTLAFQDFELASDTGEEGFRGMRSFSNINTGMSGFFGPEQNESYFSLFSFSAKWDVIPAILTQNHESEIREFMGQTSSFNRKTVKPSVLVMGKTEENDRYIYGEVGKGQFAFYGGHDPEGRRGFHREATDLNLYPNSPGYRLILNNILFPSANKKKRKT